MLAKMDVLSQETKKRENKKPLSKHGLPRSQKRNLNCAFAFLFCEMLITKQSLSEKLDSETTRMQKMSPFYEWNVLNLPTCESRSTRNLLQGPFRVHFHKN